MNTQHLHAAFVKSSSDEALIGALLGAGGGGALGALLDKKKRWRGGILGALGGGTIGGLYGSGIGKDREIRRLAGEVGDTQDQRDLAVRQLKPVQDDARLIGTFINDFDRIHRRAQGIDAAMNVAASQMTDALLKYVPRDLEDTVQYAHMLDPGKPGKESEKFTSWLDGLYNDADKLPGSIGIRSSFPGLGRPILTELKHLELPPAILDTARRVTTPQS